MPVVTATQFQNLLAAIQLAPAELARARQAAATVAARLRRRHGGFDSLVVGSIGKRTALRPPPLVDLLLIRPDGADLDTIVATVAGAGVAAGGAVRIGGVRVIPALSRDGAFVVTTPLGHRVTNPVVEAAALRLADSVSAGAATRLIALVRAWRDVCAVPLGSFAIETLAREFLAGRPGADSDAERFAAFLAWARRVTPGRFRLPGDLSELAIDEGWHGPAEAAYWRAVLAQRHAAAGARDLAAIEWRRLFGPLFPSPPADAPAIPWRIRPDID